MKMRVLLTIIKHDLYCKLSTDKIKGVKQAG